MYRALASAWIDSRTEPIDMYQDDDDRRKPGPHGTGLPFGDQAPEHIGRGRFLSRDGRDQPRAGSGSKEHIPLLDKALADSTVAYTIRENRAVQAINELATHDVQVKDMALAVGVVLSGQKLEDYGFVDNFLHLGRYHRQHV